jgi:hypothetical protein
MNVADRPFVLLLLIIAISCAPLLFVAASIGAASALGCTLNEAASHPCVVLGINIGDLLAVMFVMGWLSLASLPAGALGVGAWIIWMIVRWIARRRAGAGISGST